MIDMTEPMDPNALDGQPQQPGEGASSPYPPPDPQYGQPQYGQPQYGQPQYGQPQYGQPQYGQPEYGQPQYGQPQYGQPEYGQPQYGQPFGQPQYGQPLYGQPQYPETPPAARKRRRVVPIVASLVVLLAVAGIVAVVVAGGSTSSSPSSSTSGALSLPSTVGSYDELSGGTADQFRSTLGQSFGTGGQIGTFYAKATLGLYGDSGQPPPKYILMTAPASQFPSLRASSIGAGGVVQAFPGGSHGGGVDCFPESVASFQEFVCFWSDPQTVGFLVSINAAGSTSEVAALVNTARDTIDH